MNDLTRQLRECIEACRTSEQSMTVRAVANAFIGDMSEAERDSMKREALDNLIVTKVRTLFKKLEATNSGQMDLVGVDCPTYICTGSGVNGNRWMNTEDATISDWRSWLAIKEQNANAVVDKFAEDRELVDFMESLMGHNPLLTTKEAMSARLGSEDAA